MRKSSFGLYVNFSKCSCSHFASKYFSRHAHHMFGYCSVMLATGWLLFWLFLKKGDSSKKGEANFSGLCLPLKSFFLSGARARARARPSFFLNEKTKKETCVRDFFAFLVFVLRFWMLVSRKRKTSGYFYHTLVVLLVGALQHSSLAASVCVWQSAAALAGESGGDATR